MPKLSTFLWFCYALIITSILVGKYQALFDPYYPQNFYFHILIAFDSINYMVFYATIIQVLVNMIHLLPLVLFIFDRNFGPKIFWQMMFFVRIFMDIIGHNYEINEIVGLYHGDKMICLMFIIACIILWAPSYIACYLYAFGSKKKS